jgi:NADPH:quinone reductase-like Zn-dependent oxidoreductase
LSWTTAYQLLHRSARVQRGQRVLVHGAGGAVGQALLMLGRLAGLELWGTARSEHAAFVRELGGTPIDYQREDFTPVLPGGFDVIVDGIGEDGYRRSYAALKRDGLLCAIGSSASVQAQRRMLPILMEIARLYLWRLLPGKRARFYSVNVMRARHPTWFKENLELLFGLLATGAIRPQVAIGSPSTKSPRLTATSNRAASRASSSFAQTSGVRCLRNPVCPQRELWGLRGGNIREDSRSRHAPPTALRAGHRLSRPTRAW